MKKRIIIAISIILSLIIAINEIDSILISNSEILPIIYTILGLALTAYTFIFAPLQGLIKTHKEQKNLEDLINILKEYEDNMKYMFCVAIFLIIIDICFKLDIPFIKNPSVIDFGIFKIISLKSFLVNFFKSLATLLAINSFYDIVKATFVIVKGTLKIELS